MRCARCKRIARVPESSTRDATGGTQAKPVDARKPPSPPKPLPKPLPKSAPAQPERKSVAATSTQDNPLRQLPSKLMAILKSKLKRKPEPPSNREATSSRWSDAMPELPPEKPPTTRGAKADKPKSPDSGSRPPKSRRKSRRDRKRAKGGAESPEATTGPNDIPPAEPRAAKRKRAVRVPELMPPDVCRPDEGHLATVKWLALILGLIVLFSTGPVFVRMHWNLQAAPGWARIVVLMAVLQGVYIVWMVNHPDWASVWVVMLVFAVVASIYGTATAMVLATPLEKPMPLGMEEVRHTATAWCGAVLSAMSLATYLCGRTSAKWRRTFELEMAGKGKLAR